MEYRLDLDILKGIAIIAVVLYHVGLLPYGYLGVDTFFVINGFFIIPSVIKKIIERKFSYFTWLQKRILRFLPIVLIVTIVSMAIGFFTMLPDDYENLSESAVASCLFSNNILSAITTKNYWNTANEFKPLMHLWFLGIVVQFYIVLPLLLMANRLFKNKEKAVYVIFIAIAVISLVLWSLPQFDFNEKFYYLPFRIWEFCVGGILGMVLSKKKIVVNNVIAFSALILMVICFCYQYTSFDQINNKVTIIGMSKNETASSIVQSVMLITVVILSAICLFNKSIVFEKFKIARAFGIVGKMSLSIFVWHQVILAFMRYSFIDELTTLSFFCYIIMVSLLSVLSYKYIESIKIDKGYKKILILLTFGVTIACSFLIYKNAGVVRDVPELNITTEHPYACRNTEYIDRIYKYEKPFTTNKKIKVLVVGNSFARDFACTLLEWDNSHKLEISYQFDKECTDNRFRECDYIFIFGPKDGVPQKIWNGKKKSCIVYGIGTKNYGKSMGRIYARRNAINYHDAAIPINPLLEKINSTWKQGWGKYYIDFVENTKRSDGLMRLFTPNNKFISFDCNHLTKFGCQFYSQKFDFEHIFNVRQNENSRF